MRKNNREHKLKKDNKGKLGVNLGIVDKEGIELKTGDIVRYREYTGVLLYNHYYEKYGLALGYSKWYGDNKYKIDSYGKFIEIPMDNGAKLELERLEEF